MHALYYEATHSFTAVKSGNTPLIVATIARENLGAVEFLLAHGARVNARNKVSVHFDIRDHYIVFWMNERHARQLILSQEEIEMNKLWKYYRTTGR